MTVSKKYITEGQTLKTQSKIHPALWATKGLTITTAAILLSSELYCDPTIRTGATPNYAAMKGEYSQPGYSAHAPNNVPPPAGNKNSLGRPCNRKFDARVDFLYWKADEDGLEYGTKMKASPLIGEASHTDTQLLDLHFDWDPGFRLGFGYLFNHFDSWSLNLNWTHIRNHAHATASAKGIESQIGKVDTIISPWVNLLFELRAGASKASAHWHVDYNTLDLDFGRSVLLSKRFILNPYFGLRGAWIDQDYKAIYKSTFILAEGSPPFSRNVDFKAKNDFSAFGLRGGTELVWLLSKNWHIFSQVAGHILYGKFKVEMKNLHDQGLGEGETPPKPLNFTASEHFWRVRLSFEESIGLGWETFFRNQRYRLCLRAAYELSQWLNQNELFYSLYFRGADTISSVPVRSQGNLSFHGIRAGVQFDF